jgi:hypothetical protein
VKFQTSKLYFQKYLEFKYGSKGIVGEKYLQKLRNFYFFEIFMLLYDFESNFEMEENRQEQQYHRHH